MAVTFIEPGGDATYRIDALSTSGFLWGSVTGVEPQIVTDFVHGGHVKSTRFRPGSTQLVNTPNGSITDAGGRVSFFIYIVSLPSSSSATFGVLANGSLGSIFLFKITSAGALQFWLSSQVGADGPILATGVWYRISIAYTITSTTVNSFKLFVNGNLGISVTNATLFSTGTGVFRLGMGTADTTFDYRISDFYADTSNSLTDPGNIWVTAKRPVSNGTTNGFTTQIGVGGSGYGTGHSPQVNERPLSTTNGWSMVGAGSAVTEEYTIEGESVGDIDISTATIVDFMGWAYAKSLSSETGKIRLVNNDTNISLTSSETMYLKMANSTTYPTGSHDIGILTSATLTTVSLYEAGIVVAYTPAVPLVGSDGFFAFM